MYVEHEAEQERGPLYDSGNLNRVDQFPSQNCKAPQAHKKGSL